MEIAAILVAVVSAIVGLVAAYIANQARKSSFAVAGTQVFLELRRSHFEVQGQMDSRYHDAKWDPGTDQNAARSLERYWLHTLNEWLATTKLNQGKFRDLWNDFYAEAIQDGMRNKPLRIVLWKMLHGEPGSTFSGHREEFGIAMADLYRNKYRQELKDSV